jgi:hypothetical protein
MLLLSANKNYDTLTSTSQAYFRSSTSPLSFSMYGPFSTKTASSELQPGPPVSHRTSGAVSLLLRACGTNQRHEVDVQAGPMLMTCDVEPTSRCPHVHAAYLKEEVEHLRRVGVTVQMACPNVSFTASRQNGAPDYNTRWLKR